MQRITDNVKTRYRRKGLVNSSSTWPPFHAQSFTNLALIHQKVTQLQAKEDTTKIARLRTRGDIHKIPEMTSSIKLENIHQIFTPIALSDQIQCPMSILIEGHPGIGKTTLAKEICLQWANNQLLTSDKLVLLLMLRDPSIQRITTIEQLVKYTQSTDQVQYVLSYLQNNNGVGVTLIIDGFDELSTELHKTSFFRKLVEGDILYNARVVVTSRPSASACLHQFVHRRIEVLGFEKSSKEQYTYNALKDTPVYLNRLKVHFKQYPNIDALCYIPLNMAIIVYLCLLGSLPPTATKMYESFVLHTICRHLKRVGNILNDVSVTQIEKLPQPVCEVLQQLQEVAFDGLLNDKIVFTVEDLPVVCRDDPTCYGLLQSTECYSAEEIGTPTRSFNFLHLGIQEYFAAKFVTTLPEKKVYTLLKESFIVSDSKVKPNHNSKSVRLSNMWTLYCGITNGQCKTLRHYLTTYVKLDLPSNTPSLVLSPSTFMSPNLDPLQSLCINPSYHAAPPSQPVNSGYPETPLRDQHISMYTQPHYPPAAYHPSQQQHQQQQQLVQYPYHQPSLGNSLLLDHTRSNDPVSRPLRPSVTLSHSSHDQMFIAATTAKGQFDSPLSSSTSNTETISQDILKDPLKVLYLFQCFQEAQDNVLCEFLSKSFDSGVIDISEHSLLPHQVVSLGFFLSRSHRKWKQLNLSECHIGDHSINILHQYLCGDTANKQEITEINISDNDLTVASSHLIGDIIGHLHPHTVRLTNNNISNLSGICTAVITTGSTVRVLDIERNGLTTQEAVALSRMMACLEELYINDNKLGKHGAELLSEGVTNTETLRILDMGVNEIGPSGTTAIANALANNASLEELEIDCSKLGGAAALGNAIMNHKKLKRLSLIVQLRDSSDIIDKDSAMIIIKSLYNNNTLTELHIPITLCKDDIEVVSREVEKINSLRKLHNEPTICFNLGFFDFQNKALDGYHIDSIN